MRRKGFQVLVLWGLLLLLVVFYSDPDEYTFTYEARDLPRLVLTE